ncbi:DUF1702 family protein [Lentzea sp. BCCO 10_0856]|uniref:DUF1702 family protein n=1 Tax=Lentzea miocenica TaxID=3095431 RepID=A0ABU4TGA3_9PSEU|nr:DUF1702 family protein [Lentzea sp. BCCO 10_0856]MDX8037075.1 DUF1702 family protein [Lentzea sp. BCCO 10_0856]
MERHGSGPLSATRLTSGLRLPLSMADFSRRGFRTDSPEQRAILEGHARNFLAGFNLAVSRWRDPHGALATIPDEERGFAYEGAGMFAGLLDLGTAGRARALSRLLAGPGDGYAHLVHVGAGWLFTVARVSAVVRLPRTPLLRWLAIDGSGFGEAYFGGVRALLRRAHRTPSPVWQARLAGCGRALWFIESGRPDGVADVIGRTPPDARPHLWCGAGLAAAYAGAVDDTGRERLAELAGEHRTHLLQGVVFAAGARVRAGIVPAHTRSACAQLIGVSAEEAAGWTDETSADLTATSDVHAYLEWKARLRNRIASRL